MTRPPIEDRLNTLLTGMSAVTADDEVTAAAEKLILQTLEVLEPATEAGRLDLDAAKAFIDAFRAFEVSSMNFEAREIHTAIEDRHKELKTYIEQYQPTELPTWVTRFLNEGAAYLFPAPTGNPAIDLNNQRNALESAYAAVEKVGELARTRRPGEHTALPATADTVAAVS